MYGRPLKYFSTFSGIGGFELGIERAFSRMGRDRPADFRIPVGQETLDSTRDDNPQTSRPDGRPLYGPRPSCVGFSEIDKYAVQIYQQHFPEHTSYGDITKIDADALPDFDLFVGGFPCQAFSIAGLRKGFADTRGTLFFDIARILDARRPLHFVLENVKGLLSHDDGRTFKTIITTLVELGYGVEWQVLNSKDFGVPQNRERVFIVGHLSVEPGPQVFPFPADGEAHPELSRHVANTLTRRYEAAQATGSYIGEGELNAQEPFINQRPHGFFKGSSHSHAPSLRGASTAQNVYVNNIRRLTPTECERLQGFPDGWTEGLSDTQRYKCLGNAVTVNVIEAIMSKLYGEDTCSTSKPQNTRNSKTRVKKSAPVFGTWSSVPFKNSNNEPDSLASL